MTASSFLRKLLIWRHMAETALLLAFCLFFTCHTTARADFGNIEITGRIPTKGLVDRIALALIPILPMALESSAGPSQFSIGTPIRCKKRSPSRHGPQVLQWTL
ncbi:MAG: hypothetical protein A4E58_00598 [Syntrophorhabdus sp. PtaB.Bin006]|nr:MAG: hypothetical protein A4E58_00598 [Syntrophorhabdus sp. PtaB.Bin006]